MPRQGQHQKEYYNILGVSPQATDDEIRKAYRRLALEWHPDRNPENPKAAERFLEISEAYAVLSDSSKRWEYDQVRKANTWSDFRYSRNDLFRDMFVNPEASAVFEELAREFARMGMQVDSRFFQQTLFGGRAFVMGGIFVISPLTPLVSLFRLARAALRGAQAAASVATSEAQSLPGPSSILSSIGRMGRWLLGIPAEPVAPDSAVRAGDLVQSLELTRDEAKRGGQRRITLDLDHGSEDLLVTIPAGVSQGTKLRLRGKGRIEAGGSRGDLYLAVQIKSRGKGR